MIEKIYRCNICKDFFSKESIIAGDLIGFEFTNSERGQRNKITTKNAFQSEKHICTHCLAQFYEAVLNDKSILKKEAGILHITEKE